MVQLDINQGIGDGRLEMDVDLVDSEDQRWMLTETNCSEAEGVAMAECNTSRFPECNTSSFPE